MMRGRALTTRSTARGGRALGANGLDGTLPAELGKLTDLERLCVASHSNGGPVGAALTRCGGVQRMWGKQAQGHNRQLDRLAGEAHLHVSALSATRRGRVRTAGLARVRRRCCGVLQYDTGCRGQCFGVAPGTAVAEDARGGGRCRVGHR